MPAVAPELAAPLGAFGDLSPYARKQLQRMLLRSEEMQSEIAENVIAAPYSLTIEGASTQSLEIIDPKGDLLDSGLFDDAVRLDVPTGDPAVDLAFRLVKTAWRDGHLTVEFEDREVALMRRYNARRKASRASVTRAEFARALVREVKPDKLRFYCPELHKRLPIGRRPKPVDTARDRARAPGFNEDARLRGKEGVLGKSQLRNVATALDVAEDMKAGQRATLALIEAGLVEAPDWKNPRGGDRSSAGPLQLLASHGSLAYRRDVRNVCELFLRKGFTGRGGAIALGKRNPSWNAGQIAQAVQGSGHPSRYEEQAGHARAIIAAYQGGGGGGTIETVVDKRYDFRRGEPGGKRENTWDALKRLAEEIRWRVFVDRGVIFFISEDYLLKSRVRLIVDRNYPERSPGVDSVAIPDYDVAKPAAEAELAVWVDHWQPPIGSVVELVNYGPASGRYLVYSISGDRFEPKATMTLHLPRPQLPEPPPEQDTKSVAGDAGDSSVAHGTARARIVAIAKASMTENTGYKRYSQAGAMTTNPTPPAPARSDCSQWVRACYMKAGLPSPGVNTWDQAKKGKRTHKPKPGDLVFPAGTSHVELYVGGGQTIGHGSPPIDGWSVAGMKQRWGSVYYVTYDFLNKGKPKASAGAFGGPGSGVGGGGS